MKKTRTWHIDIIYDAYHRHSGHESAVLRQLIYAEGAVSWILLSFYKPDSFPCSALLLYFSIMVFFLLDLFQYLYLTRAYGKIADDMDNNNEKERYKSDVEPKLQELFPNLKKVAALISLVIFVMFIYNLMPICQILSSCGCSLNA